MNDIEGQLKGRDMLSLLDYTSEEVCHLILKADKMKKKHKDGDSSLPLAGKTLGMIFEKIRRVREYHLMLAWLI